VYNLEVTKKGNWAAERNADQSYVANGISVHNCVLKRNGSWYLLEATKPPRPGNPWVTANEVSDQYIPFIWFNDQNMTCFDKELCTIDVNISERPCCRCGEC
jgi:hypothetical protein